jgi:hypothetical protein
MVEHLNSSEVAKDLEARHRARRSRQLVRRIEETRSETLVTSLICAHDGVEARIELRSSVEPAAEPPRR